MRPQGHCNTDHMERDLNIVVHVQHYENMDTRTPINNLRKYSRAVHSQPPPLVTPAVVMRLDFRSVFGFTKSFSVC